MLPAEKGTTRRTICSGYLVACCARAAGMRPAAATRTTRRWASGRMGDLPLWLAGAPTRAQIKGPAKAETDLARCSAAPRRELYPFAAPTERTGTRTPRAPQQRPAVSPAVCQLGDKDRGRHWRCAQTRRRRDRRRRSGAGASDAALMAVVRDRTGKVLRAGARLAQRASNPRLQIRGFKPVPTRCDRWPADGGLGLPSAATSNALNSEAVRAGSRSPDANRLSAARAGRARRRGLRVARSQARQRGLVALAMPPPAPPGTAARAGSPRAGPRARGQRCARLAAASDRPG